MTKREEILPQQSTRVITLTNGKEAIVDADMFEELNQHRWGYLQAGGYATRMIRVEGGRRKVIFMHKVILPSPKGMVTDHINGNPLDNRRENLRICTQQQNVQNKGTRPDARSGIKGVAKIGNSWRAYVGKTHLGHYRTPEEAARAYDRAAWERYGEFARLNYPDEDPSKHPPIKCTLHRWEGGEFCLRCGEPPHPKYRPRKNGKDIK